MSNIVAQDKNMSAVESALVNNDLSKLNTDQRLAYYNKVCESVGLNPLTQPFAYISLQGKLTLYARKDAADQMRKIHGVSVQIVSKEVVGDCFIVHVRGRDKSGKDDEATGIVAIKGLSGNDLANAMMKAETKAKRRVTLSICGLGILDESELESIPKEAVQLADNPQITNPLKEVKESPVEIPEVFQDEDLGSFVCKVGKKHVNKKLSDFDAFELDNFIKSTKKWFSDERRTPSADWNEFFDKAEAYLCSLEADPQLDTNEEFPA